MNTNPRYFKLGLFVLVGLALLVAGVVALGANALFARTVLVETATTESVVGLSVGAEVKFRGVPLGRVHRIELPRARYAKHAEPGDPRFGNFVVVVLALDMRNFPGVDENEAAQILERAADAGLRARVASSGLTGPGYIELIFLDPKQFPAAKLPWTPELPIIPSAPGTFTQIINSVEDLLNEFKKAEPARLVTHFDELAVTARQFIEDVDIAELRQHTLALLDEVRDTNKRVRAILDDPRVDQTLGNVSDATAMMKGEEVRAFVADLPQISNRLRDTMQRVDEIVQSEQFRKTLDGLEKTTTNAGPAAAELRQAVREVNALLISQRQDIESILYNLRRVMENAEAVTEGMRENPSRVIFGEPPPRRNPGAQK